MQAYSGHILKKNRSGAMPSRILFYDCETKHIKNGVEEHHRLKLAWSAYCERVKNKGYKTVKYHAHYETKELCKYIESKAYSKSVLYVMGHNIYFDLQASDFFYYFTKSGWFLRFYYNDRLTYILIIGKSDRTIKILSTTNWFNCSLKALGNLVGIEKKEIDFNTTDLKTLSLYCRRDVEILVKSIDVYFTFLESNNLGKFGLTKSAQAFNAFRHRFMPKPIFIHEDEKTIKLEREAYLGGRVECFKIGEIEGGPFVSLDINSMYPYIMKNNILPVKLIASDTGCSIEGVKKLLIRYCVIADCLIETDTPIYPVRINNKMIFPVGRFRTYLCTGGLLTALKRKHIVNIDHIAIYEGESLFKDYVEYFNERKIKYGKEENKIYREISKYFMNTLYGKFGQKKPIREESIDTEGLGYYRLETYDTVSGEKEIESKLFNTKIIEKGFVNGENSFTAIPAHITEYGRLLLWKIIEQIGVDKVFYCDTDSIKIRKEDMIKITYPIDSYNLGALKIEKVFNKFIIHGSKDYVSDSEVKIKGVPKSAKLCSPNRYIYKQFMGQATHMRRKITRYYIIKNTVKFIKRKYDKGIVQPNGFVVPFYFSDV